jgi:hypothetical protein
LDRHGDSSLSGFGEVSDLNYNVEEQAAIEILGQICRAERSVPAPQLSNPDNVVDDNSRRIDEHEAGGDALDFVVVGAMQDVGESERRAKTHS